MRYGSVRPLPISAKGRTRLLDDFVGLPIEYGFHHPDTEAFRMMASCSQ
ncbi:hypothetical protein [Dyella tabacisoli]|nr:hypothetical protein [Dyella tabacisoli]